MSETEVRGEGGEHGGEEERRRKEEGEGYIEMENEQSQKKACDLNGGLRNARTSLPYWLPILQYILLIQKNRNKMEGMEGREMYILLEVNENEIAIAIVSYFLSSLLSLLCLLLVLLSLFSLVPWRCRWELEAIH